MKPIDTYKQYKIKTKAELRHCLDLEREIYLKYMYPTRMGYMLGAIRSESVYLAMKWQRLSRIADYHDYMYHTTGSNWHLFNYMWYLRRKNKIGNVLGLEISTALIGEGLTVYHQNNVIHGNSIIGKNCRVHGTVVVGNAGAGHTQSPTIGNNVMIGAGAKLIGNITIANDIKIAAGAVVVNSFTEEGITIGGVPARKLK